MDNYTKIIYPDKKMDYPRKLCHYLWSRFMHTSTLLDIGCGKGSYIHEFENLGMTCSGIDRRYDYKNTIICNIEKEPIPFKDNTFDFVFSKSLIEHIYNPENMIQEIYRVLKPGGTTIIMTPDWKSQINFFWDDYSHVHPYTRKSLGDMLRIFGFQNVSSELFYQLPFIWKYPFLKFISKIISMLPEKWKWKNNNERNGEDRKLIRFSQELMLLACGTKE